MTAAPTRPPEAAASDRNVPSGDADPRVVLDHLAGSVQPYLIGVRHHSPALAAAMPTLLDAARPDVICVELPTDFQQWLPYLADPATHAPVALAGSSDRADAPVCFYPFADFSPELAAIRWAREHDVDVVCCDLPLADPGWSADGGAVPLPSDRTRYTDALADSGTGRDGDDMWDRAVEVRAYGSTAEAVRRAALAVGWAMRQDATTAGRVAARDLAREAHMRQVIAEASANGRRVAAVVGAFHAAALVARDDAADAPADGGDQPATEAGTHATFTTSLVPYSFDLLDERSGYPAGIRDPRWQQAVYVAGGDPERVRAAAARAITDICRQLRAAGHPAGAGEAAETLRVAEDLARLRGIAAPGRGELLEAVTTVLGQGELFGRGRALARALDAVLVGADRGRTAPGTPRSGLGPAVEAELAALRLPCPDNPAFREVRLDPLRSELDRRRETLLRRLLVCGVGYGTPIEVAGTGDGTALTTKWRLAWKPSVPALLDLVGVRGVTPALAAAGTLRERFRGEAAAGGPTSAQVIAGLEAAARCDLPDLVADRLARAATVLPSAGTFSELLTALDLLEALRREHLPGTTPQIRAEVTTLAATLLDAAVRGLPGLAGSDQIEDAEALVALAIRAGDHRLGLQLDDALRHLTAAGSPLIQGAALAARVLLDLEGADTVGTRAAGWIGAAIDADGRRRLQRRLAGLLTAVGPLLQVAPDALDPMLTCVEDLTDTDFLGRLPALRGGFEVLTPAARDQLLRTVTDRLGDQIDLTLSAPPELLALWAAADTAGRAALADLPVPVLDSRENTPPPAAHEVARTEPRRSTNRRFTPVDRWRLILGRESEQLPDDARRYARALDELYGAGRGEGATEFGSHTTGPGGQGRSFPTVREWADELEVLFGEHVREEVLASAAESGRGDVVSELDPAAVRPSVTLLATVLSLAGGMPEQQLAKVRPLVRRLVAELTAQLATQLRPALVGLANPRPTRRPGGRLDLARTVRANLATTRRLADGRTVVVPERPVFTTRAARESHWHLVLVVDVSGSMEASVVWSALTAAVLAGVPTLSTHFLAFSEQVIDLTDRVSDPLSLLLEVRVGGGTHIAAALAHARTLVTVPSRTIVVVVSDFAEGYPLAGLLGEVRALAASGVHLLGCAALDDEGVPRYEVSVARQLVAAGMPIAALSPLELARWVGDRVRGGNR